MKELPTLAQGATGADALSFQAAHGLAVDEIVGPNTWPKLLNV